MRIKKVKKSGIKNKSITVKLTEANYLKLDELKTKYDVSRQVLVNKVLEECFKDKLMRIEL